MATGKYAVQPAASAPQPVKKSRFSGFRLETDRIGIGLGAMLVGIGIVIGALLFGGDKGYLTNVYTEAMAILVTVVVIDSLNRRRSALNAERELREQLMMDSASTSNETAKNAVHQMMRRNWLRGGDGMLKGADLFSCNLQGADLEGANLQGTDFRHANLHSARFVRANLSDAQLSFANLQRAELIEANLRGASLNKAKLQDANLKLANLQNANLRAAMFQGAELVSAYLQSADCFGANFENADLTAARFAGANLSHAKFNPNTIMPNGMHWTTNTDLRFFTDPQHPQYYKDDWSFNSSDSLPPAAATLPAPTNP